MSKKKLDLKKYKSYEKVMEKDKLKRLPAFCLNLVYHIHSTDNRTNMFSKICIVIDN